MKDEKKERIFFVTPWPFVLSAILFALVTPRYLDLYGYGHWSVTQTAFLIDVSFENLKNEIYPKISDDKIQREIEKTSQIMKSSSSKLKKAGSKIMSAGYHITGIISLMFTVFAFACKPHWAGIISLPFSLYAMKYFFIIM
ncbi:MAG: hypothetical protein D3916_02330 [Candidatus Electrothrix sp. MAN1_4]|nr:hypothetical protein [Candidatus Electrothrix sp. MAN1_4]